MAFSDRTVEVKVERLPIWHWPISIPRSVFTRSRWLHSYGRPRWKTLLAAAYLGTFRIRFGTKDI